MPQSTPTSDTAPIKKRCYHRRLPDPGPIKITTPTLVLPKVGSFDISECAIRPVLRAEMAQAATARSDTQPATPQQHPAAFPQDQQALASAVLELVKELRKQRLAGPSSEPPNTTTVTALSEDTPATVQHPKLCSTYLDPFDAARKPLRRARLEVSCHMYLTFPFNRVTEFLEWYNEQYGRRLHAGGLNTFLRQFVDILGVDPLEIEAATKRMDARAATHPRRTKAEKRARDRARAKRAAKTQAKAEKQAKTPHPTP